MDEIILLFPERLLLTKIRIFRKVKLRDTSAFKKLHEYGLIAQNFTNKRNQYGVRLLDDTVSCTDFCKRWIVQKRIDFRHRVFTPLWVSIISSVVSSVIVSIITSIITLRSML